jgi:hypothetical protein
MGGAVFPECDTVMGKDEDRVHVHERGKTQGRSHVIGKNQESRGIRYDSPVQGHAINDGAHRMLAHTETDVAAGFRSFGLIG